MPSTAVGLWSGSVWLTAAALFVAGTGISIWDVAMNVEGAAVERQLHRSIMSKFHAGFSLGTVLGAAVSAAAAAVGIGVAAQTLGTAVADGGHRRGRRHPDVHAVREARGARGEVALAAAEGMDEAAHPDRRPDGAGVRLHRGSRQRLDGGRVRGRDGDQPGGRRARLRRVRHRDDDRSADGRHGHRPLGPGRRAARRPLVAAAGVLLVATGPDVALR